MQKKRIYVIIKNNAVPTLLFFRCQIVNRKEINIMKHIKTVNKANLKETAAKGGCGKCQTSCQSACKTSCTVANQTCEANK